MKFEMTMAEAERYWRFREKHKHTEVEPTTIGGKFSIEFTPTGLGNVVKCKCNICKETENITDYDKW